MLSCVTYLVGRAGHRLLPARGMLFSKRSMCVRLGTGHAGRQWQTAGLLGRGSVLGQLGCSMQQMESRKHAALAQLAMQAPMRMG